MKQWLITGANRLDGKPMRIMVHAKTERGAQDQAYELNMLIETLEDLSTLATDRARQDVDKPEPSPRVRKMNEWATKENVRSPSQPDVTYESIESSGEMNRRQSFWQYTKESRKKRRAQYLERGVNTVSEMAVAVFLGLLMFSCASPLVFVFVITFWMAWGRAMAEGY